MFCPQCGTEYRPIIRRCADCDVPLVERLPVAAGHPEPRRLSGFELFKQLGVFIVLPPTILATAFVLAAMNGKPFQIQIASVIMVTGFVFFFVFCDAGSRAGKGTKGFSLGEKAVRQKLPVLACCHAGVLTVLFAGITEVIWLRTHTQFLWQLSLDPFLLVFFAAGAAITIAEIYTFRRLLARADE